MIDALANTDRTIKVLDHGYVQLVDVMPRVLEEGETCDHAIVDAARVSYQEGTTRKSTDQGLINYLMRHRHCYHPDMEVLTLGGWKKWRDCDNQEVFAVPTKDRQIKWERLPLEEFDTDEEMCCFENNRMSYCVTPDHRMWFKGKYQDDYSIVRAEEMSKWGHFQSLLDFAEDDPLSGQSDPKWEFIGFFLGDGSRSSTNRFSFHLKKERKKKYLEYLCSELNIEYTKTQSATYEDANVYYVTIPAFLNTIFGMSSQLAIFSQRSSSKHLPLQYLRQRNILQGSLEDLPSVPTVRGLLKGLIASDGSHKKDRSQIEFHSSSTELIKVFETCCAILGIDAHSRYENENRSTAFIGSRTSLESRAQYHSTKYYSGKVYCTTTSTGLLLVRGGPDKFAFVCGNTSPFEMVEFKFECRMPIFVARQWIRHRTCSVNEESARYSKMRGDFYLPDNLRQQSTKNKQATDDEGFNPEIATLDYENIESTELIKEISVTDYNAYTQMLEAGVAREQARMVLPVNLYTSWVWKMDLHNLLHFLRLRLDPHAQYEIRVYAEAIAEFVKQLCPWTWEAFQKYQLEGQSFTRSEMEAIRSMLNTNGLGEGVLRESIEEEGTPNSMSKGEFREFLAKLEKL